MKKYFKYIVAYNFEIKGIELYIAQNNKSFGIKKKELEQLIQLEYNNNYGDTFLAVIDWKKSKIKKDSKGFKIIDSIYGTINIGFPNELGKNYDHRKFDSYFRCFIHLLFFIFNVSLPGSIEVGRCEYVFSNMGIKKDKENDVLGVNEALQGGGKFDILSDETFYEMYQQNIINIEEISLKKVAERTQKFSLWFEPLSSKTNRLETAIFGLFHLFLNKNLNNESLLEVFYISQILEAIYSSPEERIGKTLVNRIKTLININDKTYGKLKKIFLGFYDLRSKFVHGDYHINNPILFDNFIDDKDGISKIWDDIRKKDINVIYAIIFASLQKIINQGLTKIEFEEVLVK